MQANQQVKVNLFTVDLKPVGEYHAPSPPRVGESLSWEGEYYEVKTVHWEGLKDNPAVQVRLE